MSRHAWLDVSSARLSRSPDPARDSIMRCIRTSVIPSSSRISIAVLPLRSASSSPWMNRDSAPAASSPQACAKSRPVMPATRAKSSSPLPVFTAFCSSTISLLADVEPAWDSMPRELMAADRPMISASLMPTMSALAAMPWAIFRIFCSVVA